MPSKLLVFLLAVFLIAQTGAFADVTRIVTVQQGGPFTSNSNQIQMFPQDITSDKINGSQPLTLTVNNGAGNSRPFAWLRVYLTDGRAHQNPSAPTGRMIISDTAFRRSRTVSLDVTGQLSQGTNHLLITGAGIPGAEVTWALTSALGAGTAGGGAGGGGGGFVISSINPQVAQAGGEIKISGLGFNTSISSNTAYFTQKYQQPAKATTVDATPTLLRVKVPSTIQAGDCQLQVVSGGQKSNVLSIQARGTPEITGSSLQAGPVGTVFTFTGKNFSPSGGDNVLSLSLTGSLQDGHPASATGATATSFSFTLPQFPELGDSPFFNPPRRVWVFLTVAGVPAKPTDGYVIYCSRAPW